MKRIDFSRQFEKHYAKRIRPNKSLQRAYAERYILFAAGERGYPLNDHLLTKSMAGKRAFSVSANIRVVYKETDEAIIFIDVGSHNQVYK